MDQSLTTATPARSTHPLIIIAAIAVILFSVAGVAAIMGWIPSSKGDQSPSAQLASTAPSAPATSPSSPVEAKPAVKPATKPSSAATHQSARRSDTAPAPAARHDNTQVAAITPPPPPAPVIAAAEPVKVVCNDCGTIESVREVQKKGEGSGLGAAAGGVLGGVLGHQVGNGRGQSVATVLGAVGGAFAGHQVEKSTKSTVVYDVTVRFNDGTTRTLQQNSAPAWRSGDKVRVVNSEILPAS